MGFKDVTPVGLAGFVVLRVVAPLPIVLPEVSYLLTGLVTDFLLGVFSFLATLFLTEFLLHGLILLVTLLSIGVMLCLTGFSLYLRHGFPLESIVYVCMCIHQMP